jgi:hypothetical protein
MKRDGPRVGDGARGDLTVDEQLHADRVGIGHEPQADRLLDRAGAAHRATEDEVVQWTRRDGRRGQHSRDQPLVHRHPHIRREVVVGDGLGGGTGRRAVVSRQVGERGPHVGCRCRRAIGLERFQCQQQPGRRRFEARRCQGLGESGEPR